jgi:uncharacterized membrane protein (DUF485 family)
MSLTDKVELLAIIGAAISMASLIFSLVVAYVMNAKANAQFNKLNVGQKKILSTTEERKAPTSQEH